MSFAIHFYGAVSKCRLKFSCCQTGLIHGKYLEHTVAKGFICSRRTFFTWLSKFGTKKNYFKKDGIEKRTHNLVYFSPNVNYAVWTQAICVVSGALISTMVLTSTFTNLGHVGLDLYGTTSDDNKVVFESMAEVALTLGAFGAIVTAATLVSRRMVLRLYYNGAKNRFVAVVPHWVPFKVSKFEFAGGQMALVKASSAFQYLRGEYVLANERYIISKYFFRSPYHYNIMMGYEKPDDVRTPNGKL